MRGRSQSRKQLVRDVYILRPTTTYRYAEEVAAISVFTFFDANGDKECLYGQSVLIIGLLIRSRYPKESFYHAIGCSSHKQRRVSYSSFGAETIAAAVSEDRVFDNKISILFFLFLCVTSSWCILILSSRRLLPSTRATTTVCAERCPACAINLNQRSLTPCARSQALATFPTR